eukprot:INCI7478.2.p1 GENE.INCI7478.2~~INCI7478.2.p1  ORF type:complete len:3599 (+),score=636.15 INCI7478.2:904-11700(+)
MSSRQSTPQVLQDANDALVAKRAAEDDAAALAVELNSAAAQNYTVEVRANMEASLTAKRKAAAQAATDAEYASKRAEAMKGKVLTYGFNSKGDALARRVEHRQELNGILGLPRSAGTSELIPRSSALDDDDADSASASCGTVGAYVDLSKQVAAHQKQMFRQLMEDIGGGSGGPRGRRASALNVPPDAETKTMSFDQLVGMGNSLKTMDVLAVREYKRKVHDDMLDAKAREFDRKHAMAAKRLERIDSAGHSPSASSTFADDESDADTSNVGEGIDPLLAKNIILQTPVSDAHTNAAVYNVDVKTAPPLCTLWTLNQCAKKSSECKHRHYFGSHAEKQKTIAWAKKIIHGLERPILESVTMRETLLDQVRDAAQAAAQAFADHTHGARYEDVQDVLRLLNQLRVATVHVVEAIGKWQQHVKEEHLVALGSGGGGELNAYATRDQCKWIVRLAVPGEEISGPSPAFTSAQKRFSRPARLPQKATIWLYIGKFRTRVEAESAYDKACVHESTRLGCLPSHLPPRVFRLRSCGKHNVIESATSAVPRTACEECAVVRLRNAPEYTPSWTLNGQNYLLKMMGDLAFLGFNEALCDFLPHGFRFVNNPLLRHDYSGERQYGQSQINNRDGPASGTPRSQQKPQSAQAAERPHVGPSQRPASSALGSSESSPSSPQSRFGAFNTAVDKYADGLMAIDGTGFRRQRVNRGPGSPAAILDPSRLLGNGDANGTQSLGQEAQDGTTLVGGNVMVLTAERLAACEAIVLREKNVHAAADATVDETKDVALGDEDSDLESPTAADGRIIVPVTKTAYIADHTGAVLAIPQRRTVHLPESGEKRFCDYADGPFASLRVRGRHSKAIAYKREAAAVGEGRITERRKVLRRLKRALRDEDEPRLPALIEYAERVAQQGDEMQAVIALAKKFLFDQAKRRKAAGLWQRVFRGCLGRAAARARARALSHTSSSLGAYMSAVQKAAPSFVQNMLDAAVGKVARRLRRREHVQVQEMDTEHCVFTVYDRHHRDYFKRSGLPCPACCRSPHQMRRRMNVSLGRYVLAPGPCTCVWPRQPERLVFRAYNPISKAVYQHEVSADEVCRQVLWLVRNGHLPREHVVELQQSVTRDDELGHSPQSRTLDDLVVAAASSALSIANERGRVQPLPTDNILRYGDRSSLTSLCERSRFEPVWEDRVVRGAVFALERREAGTCATEAKLGREWNLLSRRVGVAKQAAQRSFHGFVVAKANWLRSVVNRTTLIRLSDEAMDFSKSTLAAYDDAQVGAQQQTYDPKEDATTFVFLKQKREAVKEEARRRQILQAALTAAQKAHSTWRLVQVDADHLKLRIDACTKQRRDVTVQLEQAREVALVSKQLKRRVLELYISRLTLRTKATIPLQRILVYDDPNWYLPRPPEGLGVDAEARMASWLRLVSPGWNACLRESRTLASAPADDPGGSFEKWEGRRGGRFFVTIYWSRMRDNPSMAEDLVIEAYDPRKNKTQRLLLVQREIRQLLVGDLGPPWLRQRWPELFAPIDTSGLFVDQQRNTQQAHAAIVQTILRLVRLNAHDGRLECGKLRWWRSRRTLLEELRFGCRWWHDVQQQKSSTKGTQIFREGRRVGSRRCYVSVFENWGDLTLEVFDVKRNRFADVQIPQAVIGESLATVSPVLADIWRLSVKSGRYARTLMHTIVDRLRLRSLEPGEVLSLQQKAEVAEHVIKSVGLGFKYCSLPSCPRGRLPIAEFIDDIGRIHHLCHRCYRPTKPRRINNGLVALVYRRREQQTYDVVMHRTHPVNGILLDVNVQSNHRGDLIVNADALPTAIVENKRHILLQDAKAQATASSSSRPNAPSPAATCITNTHAVALRPIRLARPTVREVFSESLEVLRRGNEAAFWNEFVKLLALRIPTALQPTPGPPGATFAELQAPAPPPAIPAADTQLVLSRRAAGREHSLLKWAGHLDMADDMSRACDNFWHGRLVVEVRSPYNNGQYDEYRIAIRREGLHEWEHRSSMREMADMAAEETRSHQAWSLRARLDRGLSRAVSLVREVLRKHRLQLFVRRVALYFRRLYEQWRQRVLAAARSLCFAEGLALVDGIVSVPVELGLGVAQNVPRRRLLRRTALFETKRRLPLIKTPKLQNEQKHPNRGGDRSTSPGNRHESTVDAQLTAFKVQRSVYVEIDFAGERCCIEVDTQRMYGMAAERESQEQKLVEHHLRRASWGDPSAHTEYFLRLPALLEAQLFWQKNSSQRVHDESCIIPLKKGIGGGRELWMRWKCKHNLRLWSTHAHLDHGMRRCLTKLWCDERFVWVDSNLHDRRNGSRTSLLVVERSNLRRLLGHDTTPAEQSGTADSKHKGRASSKNTTERLSSSQFPEDSAVPSFFQLQVGTHVAVVAAVAPASSRPTEPKAQEGSGRRTSIAPILYRGEIIRMNENHTFRLHLSDGRVLDEVQRETFVIDAEAERNTARAARARKAAAEAARKEALDRKQRDILQTSDPHTAAQLNLQSKAEQKMRAKLAGAMKKLDEAERLALEKAGAVDAANASAMGALFVPLAESKSLQGLKLTPNTWQRALPQLLGDPKAIERVVVGSYAYFFQRGMPANARASELLQAEATKSAAVTDIVSVTGDCVFLRQGRTREIQEILFRFKRRRLKSQFEQALQAMEGQGKATQRTADSSEVKAFRGSVAAPPVAVAGNSGDSNGTALSSEASKRQADGPVNKNSPAQRKTVGTTSETHKKRINLPWRVDMRQRTSLFKQLIPGTRAVIEALPLHRVRTFRWQQQLPVQGEEVHIVRGGNAPPLLATVVRLLKPKRSSGEQSVEVLVQERGLVAVCPVSTVARLPRPHIFSARVAHIADLVSCKLGSRPGYREPSENELLATFLQTQVRVRPRARTSSIDNQAQDGAQKPMSEESGPVLDTRSAKASVVRQSASPLVQHPNAPHSKYLQLLDFVGFAPGSGVAGDGLAVEVRHVLWQRPIMRRRQHFLLEGFYNGSSALISVFDTHRNASARLLLNKYDIAARLATKPAAGARTGGIASRPEHHLEQVRSLVSLTAKQLTQLFRRCSKDVRLLSLPEAAAGERGGPPVLPTDNAANYYMDGENAGTAWYFVGLKGMDWLSPKWAMEEAARAAVLHKAQQAQSADDRAVAVARQLLCQRARVRRSWFAVEQLRRKREAVAAANPTAPERGLFREWSQMRAADAESAHIRPYLTIPHAQLEDLRATFSHFDKDGNGQIGAQEFQDMMYEVKREVLDKEAVQSALNEIDRDGNGIIDFNEFVWWFVTPRSEYDNTGATGIAGFFLKLQLDIKKNSRAWHRRMLEGEARAKARRRERAATLSAMLRARQIASAAKQRALKLTRDARQKAAQSRIQLQERRASARERAIAGLKRTREMAALKTPEEREAYRVAHLTPEERALEEERKRVERARIDAELTEKARLEDERLSRELLAAQLRQEAEAREAAQQKLREEAAAAKAKAAELLRRAEERTLAAAREAEEVAAREALAREAAERKRAAQAEEAAAMETERLQELAAAREAMTDDERAASDAAEKELQLQRLGEQRMAKQLEAEKLMQKKLERADRAKRRAEKEKKKAAKQKLKQKQKQAGKDKRKRDILAKRASSKK